MSVSVSILCDNIAAPPSFLGEHGLSVLVKTETGSVLYDCGQSGVALKNARSMGIDIRSVDAIAISHGHYDHTGGLLSVLGEAGKKPVYAHPETFFPRYFKAGETKRYIGFPSALDALRNSCADLLLEREPVEVIPRVHLTGEVPVMEEYRQIETALYKEKGGELVVDDFSDDQSLIVETGDGVVVVTGCAHVGIANIVNHVSSAFGKIRAIIGGIHLGLTGRKALSKALGVLRGLEAEKFVFCHCTGVRLYGVFERDFGDRFAMGHAGMAIEF